MELLAALERCHHVAPDHRRPDSHYALARLPSRRTLRVDFTVRQDAAGTRYYIVTAYDVT